MFESITNDEGVYTVQGSVLLKFSNGRDKMENLMRFIEENFNVLNTEAFHKKSSMWRAFNGELWKEFNGETSWKTRISSGVCHLRIHLKWQEFLPEIRYHTKSWRSSILKFSSPDVKQKWDVFLTITDSRFLFKWGRVGKLDFVNSKRLVFV